ncbi:nuclear transport factor 2 family protein [Nocardioides humi]|uniref:SnoaL-like domain-containing protein n=1 Tax=Nocardioides humi TaxID=449461 RepID=A0ABN2A9I6_9ACTN|nr:hypothetical protein [Nocardioides humi]
MTRPSARDAYAGLLAAYGKGTAPALEAVVAPDVHYVIHGEATLSGSYRGVAGMLEWIDLAGRISGGTARFAPEVITTDESGERSDVVAIGVASVEREGGVLRTGHIYHLRWQDGLLVEGHTYPADPATFRQVWS